jgi:hydrogenase expression/formation protein HypC
MCIAVPYKIVETSENGRAQIEVGNSRQEIIVDMIPDVKVGDYVLLYCGTAVAKIEEAEALEVLSLFREMAKASDKEYEAV